MMVMESFLTARWNNMLSLGLGLITLIYVIAALSASVWSDSGGFIGLVIIGGLF
jgi:hypothetical protein